MTTRMDRNDALTPDSPLLRAQQREQKKEVMETARVSPATADVRDTVEEPNRSKRQ
jgi:hypothetical protein